MRWPSIARFALVDRSHLLLGSHLSLLAFVACWHCCLLAFKLIILVTLVEIKRNRRYLVLSTLHSSATAQRMGLPSGRGYALKYIQLLALASTVLCPSLGSLLPIFLSSSIHLVGASWLSPAFLLFWHVLLAQLLADMASFLGDWTRWL